MDCDDGLCSPCLEDHKVNKASKKHQIIPVSQYVGIESVSSLIEQKCEEHDQRLTFYCLDHCVTVCALCVPELAGRTKTDLQASHLDNLESDLIKEMASSTDKLCGPCEARYITTTAVSWCMDCDDGLCSPCLEDHKVNKASKKHQTIPVGQYVGIESVSSLIKQDCEEHDQRLTFYCLDHCVTACALCVPEKHKQCTSLKPIEELSRNAKSKH
ncbi:unnamed protein product [Mytilus coruscus]|uniref:B box-type domain-containing protein n=1 Tax=Mytilus coruscus TaxID=42192 RepID=A0A6J8EE42_MYTCO|nr:unnamed protein product [Mytilus coruscus]